jgi:hypothetical protein
MDRPVLSKSIGKYSVTYGTNRTGSAQGTDIVPDRVKAILNAVGLCRRVGWTEETQDEEDGFIPVT